MARPATAIKQTSRRIIHTMRPVDAPSAVRMPISVVRRATLNATVPYRPMHAMTSARTAKAVQSLAA